MRIFRLLWRRPRLVAGVAIVAVVAGMAVTYRLPSLQHRSYQVGLATGQILLDTPDSDIVALAPKGAEDLGVRANVIASLMVSGDVEAAIARQAGLRPSQLGGTTGAATLGSMQYGASALPSSGPAGRGAYFLTTQTLVDTLNDPLPIIEFSAQGPNPAAAARLANAALIGLRDYLATKAAAENIPDAGRIQVAGLGVPQVTTQSHGPTATIGLGVAILVFVLGCAGIAVLPILARSWRAAAALEHPQRDAAAAPDSEVIPGETRGERPEHPLPVNGSNGAFDAHEDRRVALARVNANARTPIEVGAARASSRSAVSDADEVGDERIAASRDPRTPADGSQAGVRTVWLRRAQSAATGPAAE